jgi:ketosteroid isomerase-like protein
MSQENVEIVRRAIAAFIEGDYERLIELSDPQIEYDVSRTSPEARVVRGPQEVLAVLQEWVDTWDDHQVELVELIDAGGERVVAVIQERGKLKDSETWVEHPRGVVYTVREAARLRE